MRSRPTLHATGSPSPQPMPHTGHEDRFGGISPSEPLRRRGGLAMTSDRLQSSRARSFDRRRIGAHFRAADAVDRVASELTEPPADDDAVVLRSSARSARLRTVSTLPSTVRDSREWSCRRSAARATERGGTTETGGVFTLARYRARRSVCQLDLGPTLSAAGLRTAIPRRGQRVHGAAEFVKVERFL